MARRRRLRYDQGVVVAGPPVGRPPLRAVATLPSRFLVRHWWSSLIAPGWRSRPSSRIRGCRLVRRCAGARGRCSRCTLRRRRPARPQRDLAARWWTLLACGPRSRDRHRHDDGTGRAERTDGRSRALALLVAVTLLGTGVVLGFARLADRHRTSVASRHDPSLVLVRLADDGLQIEDRTGLTRRPYTPRPSCFVWGRKGSNLRPRDYESPALTTELRPRTAHSAAPIRTRPSTPARPRRLRRARRRCRSASARRRSPR